MAKKKQFYQDQPHTILKGTVRMHARGFGFVQHQEHALYDQDIFIPKHCTNFAVDGDLVEVEVNAIVSNKGPEGKIISILERSRSHLAGIVYEIEPTGEGYAYIPLLGEDASILVRDAMAQGVRVGDRVVLEIEHWGSHDRYTIGKIEHILGSIQSPEVDVLAAIEEFSLHKDFSHEAIREAQQFPQIIDPEQYPDRQNLLSLTTITIDPDTAKDFDDAISIKKSSNGNFKLYVHIADVSAYVKPGTHLDQEARLRCNSTYFPGTCLPMLPEELSNGLCSLNPKVVRLAITVEMDFDPEGSLQKHKIYRSLICSNHRFTYAEAKEILDGKRKGPFLRYLHLMQELCSLLKKQKKGRGGVEFESPEVVIQVNAQGVPQGFETVEYDITHQMIEEFMVKANEVVARDLTEKNRLITYRVHDTPDPQQLDTFTKLVRSMGYTLKTNPTPHELQGFFDQIKDSPLYPFLITHYIKSMKIALYSPENRGHYGLSLEHYCHFTSPIRRYCDLIVHRVLFGHRYEEEELEKIAHDASESERVSAKAEMNVKLLKKLRYLNTLMEQNQNQAFDAVIVHVKSFGVVFEVIELNMEGYLAVSDLHDDYYIFDQKKNCLRGKDSGTMFRVGTPLKVHCQTIDLALLETKWALSKTEKRVKKEKKKPRKSRKAKK